MSKKKSRYDVLIKMGETLTGKLKSDAGKANVVAEVLLFMLACVFATTPVVAYILKMLQTLCNTVLVCFDKKPLAVETLSIPIHLIWICFGFLCVESLICTGIVLYSERKKQQK